MQSRQKVKRLGLDRQSGYLKEKNKCFNLESGKSMFALEQILKTDPKIIIV
jgi:hypothetical protein